MKTTMQNYKRALLATALMGFLVLALAAPAMADDGPYRHDHNGYWDDHHAYHHFDSYHNHHGYWHTDNGARIFINVD